MIGTDLSWFGKCIFQLTMIMMLMAIAGSGSEAQTADTLLAGNEALRADRLPFGLQVISSFKLENGKRQPTSSTEQTIFRTLVGSEQAIRIATTHVSSGGDTTRGEILIRARDFGLIHHRVEAKADSAAVSCSDGYLTGWVVLPEQPVKLLDQMLSRPVLPVDGPMSWLVCALPLREDYRVTIPRFNQWAGKEVWSEYHVLGSEGVEIAGQLLDCWKVDMGPIGPPGYRAMRWVAKDSGRVVQSVLRSDERELQYWGVETEWHPE